MAMGSRLKIPLLFGQDIIHGYRTTFPIPLAEAASWDLEAIESSARVAGHEAAAAGVHWTLHRWWISPVTHAGAGDGGRGRRSLSGFLYPQGRGYWGSRQGVRRYRSRNGLRQTLCRLRRRHRRQGLYSVDMSLRTLWEVYLPPFKAAEEAGAATFMNSFNDLNGIPATGNAYLQREVLKGKWKFKGFVVSDWGSVGEMINHGYAKITKKQRSKRSPPAATWTWKAGAYR